MGFAALILLIFGLVVGTSSYAPSNQPLVPHPTRAPSRNSGMFCLPEEEFDSIVSGPVELTCDRKEFSQPYNPNGPVEEPAVQWVKAASNVKVDRIFIHNEKQLILKDQCGGVNYYTWKCHPGTDTEWGMLYANTMWKLIDSDPNRQIRNNDSFDVYMRKDASYEPFKKWCTGIYPTVATGSMQAGNAAFTTAANNPLEGRTVAIASYEGMWAYHGTIPSELDRQSSPPRRLIGEVTIDGKTYSGYVNALVGMGIDEAKVFYLAEKGAMEGNVPVEYDQFVILQKSVPTGKSLQLGSFKVVLPQQEWLKVYLPDSKPIIYLYPPVPTLVDVKITVPQGRITVSNPPYPPEGWEKVKAYPSGKLEYNNASYSSLYYESETTSYTPPPYGVVLPKEAVAPYLKQTLTGYKLTPVEQKDFLDYWLQRIDKEIVLPFVHVAFIEPTTIETAELLDVSQPIDTSIRLRVYLKGTMHAHLPLAPQPIYRYPDREGFTMVEWGGILDKKT